MKVHIWGTDFRRSASDFRAKLVVPADQRPIFLDRLRALGFQDLVYLATCNRVEFCTTAPDYFCDTRALWLSLLQALGLSAEDFYRGYHYEGKSALRHLLRVASSLESLVIGEPQILGQLKQSFADSIESSLPPNPSLDRMLRFVFETAKRVRTETALGEKPVSVASLAVQHMESLEPEFPLRKVVLVGRGPMSVAVAQWLQKHRPSVPVLWVNRRPELLEALPQAAGVPKQGLAEFLARPAEFSHLFTATASAQPIFGAAFFDALSCGRRVICDFAEPSDVAEEAGFNPHLHLVRIESLHQEAKANAAWRATAVGAAEAKIDEAIKLYCLAQKEAPFLRDLSRWEPQFVDELGKHLDELRGFLPSDLEPELKAWSEKLVKKSLHHSREHLKGVLRQITDPDKPLTPVV